jgi:hypothetical protein
MASIQLMACWTLEKIYLNIYVKLRPLVKLKDSNEG